MAKGDRDGTGQMEALVAGGEDAGRRVDLFISKNAPDDISRARVQALVRQGHVTINGLKPRGTSAKLAEGDVVRFLMPEPEDARPEPEAIPLDILFEDADLIVVNKMAGMVVHPAPGNLTGTLVNALLHHCGDALSGIGGVRRPGIVHRLDKETSGVMVVAKSYRAHIGLQEQFADHGRSGPLQRAYQAIVWGGLPRMKGSIDAWLGRHPSDRLKRAVVSQGKADAKRAVTHYSVEQTFGGDGGDPTASLLECRLETGRTHQIRVHLAHAGHPLLGDPVYGRSHMTRSAKLPEEAQAALAALNRQALHAAVLGFAHPATGETIRFEAPLPPDMMGLIRTLKG